MKFHLDLNKVYPGFYMTPDGEVHPWPDSPNKERPEGAVEVCTADGKEWHQLDWYWARMNHAVRDNVSKEAASDQDQLNMCIIRAADLGVPLFKED